MVIQIMIIKNLFFFFNNTFPIKSISEFMQIELTGLPGSPGAPGAPMGPLGPALPGAPTAPALPWSP